MMTSKQADRLADCFERQSKETLSISSKNYFEGRRDQMREVARWLREDENEQEGIPADF